MTEQRWTRIQQLPHAVITKISAGEVIERPASVVKELLENSIDAGGNRIDIEIEEGGGELIRLADNGCGIRGEDLPLAFASHATSKLENADDLFRIRTLGFRGEALASIGGVAQVTLQSRPPDQPTGAEITCHGGESSPVRAWNGAPGTRIEVRHLFYNTPVRRKFLRTTATEIGHISEVFTRVALAYPNLHLTLRHNDKEVYEVPASASLLDRVGLFFGKEVRDRLYPVEVTQGLMRLRGFVADPSCERGTAKMQYLFVNGRWIRDRSLGHAIQEAYRGLLMTGRYAVVFLFLDLPPDQVDVNVHPTKVEVRFRDAQAAHHLMFSGIRDRLRMENLTALLRVPPQGNFQLVRQMAPVDRGQSELLPYPTPNPIPSTQYPSTRHSELSTQNSALSTPRPDDSLETPGTPGSPLPSQRSTLNTQHSSALSFQHSELSTPPLEKAIQLHDAYLVLETPEGMLVIDQHALHERILFEQLKGRIRAGDLEKQRLLVPEPMDLPAEQAARVLDQQQALAELGLEVEDFGGGTVLLRSYPAIIGDRSPQKIFRAVVDYLAAKERLPNREQLLNDLLSLMACRAAVKAGDRLNQDQITALVAQRNLANDAHHCPHGRPTSLLLSKQELDRQFGRI